MTRGRLLVANLRHHRREHLGLAAGVAVAAAAVVGALAVGDSIRASLRALALQRLGTVTHALDGRTRTFRASLAGALAGEGEDAQAAPVLALDASATLPDGSRRTGEVRVLGVDARFWALGGLALDRLSGAPLQDDADPVILSRALAETLQIGPGATVVLRVRKLDGLPGDAPFAAEDASVLLRVVVRDVAPDEALGRFGLDAGQEPPLNAFFPLAWLQERMRLPGRANLILASGDLDMSTRSRQPHVDKSTRVDWNARLSSAWTLDDAELELRTVAGLTELRSRRLFLDPAVARAAEDADSSALQVFSYFVNELRLGERATPYSIVTGLSPGALMPAEMKDDEVLLNAWLAEDLGAQRGDRIDLAYFVLAPDGALVERTSAFRVRDVVPVEALDATLMPEIPGLANADHCRDWEPGVPIDLARIRPRDEAYWDRHRGTPKALVTFAAAQRMWHNRFGDRTAVRSRATIPALDASLRAALRPEALGLQFEPVRERALAAGRGSTDFGALFLGFGSFLVAAALLLAGLLFVLAVERRAGEVQALVALGFEPREVQRLLFAEGALVAAAGVILGAGGGALYAKAVLLALGSAWRGAIGLTSLSFALDPASLAVGMAGTLAAALGTLWIALWRRALAQAAAGKLNERSFSDWRAPAALALAAALAALSLAWLGAGASGETAAAAFFGAGALVLVCGVALGAALLARLARGGPTSLPALALRSAARNPGRSQVTLGLLACGSFLVIGVGANRHDARQDAVRRDSGTGGFALLARTTLPLPRRPEGIAAVPLRLRGGDDASCLNLNQAQVPRILGVAPAALAGRFTFAEAEGPGGWSLLEGDLGPDVVPAVGDETTVRWLLHRALGDEVPYTDERGRAFRARIVGILGTSILQGHLIIAEPRFVERFPSEGGHRMLLVDAPADEDALAALLADLGARIEPAWRRLAALREVENTYLAIFEALGAFGLMLGCLGLGVLVLRHALERRGELALLRAVGYTQSEVRRLIAYEHAFLALFGLGIGLAAALVALLPALAATGAELPLGTAAAHFAAVLAVGVAATLLASRLALRGPILAALSED